MVKIGEIIEFLEGYAPEYLAEDYDNVGLLCESENKECQNVLLSLDTDVSVVNEAKKRNCQLIISHHPLIFRPLRRVKNEDALTYLIKNDIALFAMHTNLDTVKDGLCDFLLGKIANGNEVRALDGDENGIGRITSLDEPIELSALCEKIKKNLSMKSIRFVGDEKKKISSLAICSGGGGDMTENAYYMGADCYISGDFKYHQARFAHENDMALIEIPHYEAEIIFTEFMKNILSEKFGDKLNIFISEENVNPWKQK